jgi:hypothetical protein
MTRSRLRALGFLLAAAPCFALALVLAETARGDERATAEALLAAIEHDTAHATLTADAVKQSRVALERATRMRDANDEPRARLAEGLGLRWAEVARDLVRAADAEQSANEARLAANDAGARSERERARLEEAIARQGRLQAEMDALSSKQGPERTAAIGANVDGGAGAKPPRAPTTNKARTSNGGSNGGSSGGPLPRLGADAGVMP